MQPLALLVNTAVTRLQQEPAATAVEGCDAAMPGGRAVSVLPPDANTAIAFFGGLAGFLGLAALLSTAAVVLKPKLARVPALYYFANIVHLGAVMWLLMLSRTVSMSALGRYAVATLAFVFAWRSLELECGIVPEATMAHSRSEKVLYLSSPVEPRYKDGKLAKSRPHHILGFCRRLLLKQLALTAWTSALDIDRFVAPSGSSMVNCYVQTWVLYLFMSQQVDLLSVVLGGAGCLPVTIFRNPLLESRSPRDFWGARWNLIIHGLLKRTVFAPLKARRCASGLCALATFAASGLFHVYVLYAACDPDHMDGLKLLGFFLIQAPLTFIEVALIRRFPIVTRLPTPLCALATALMLMPVAPLFMGPYGNGGLFRDIYALQPKVVLAPHWRDAVRSAVLPLRRRLL